MEEENLNKEEQDIEFEGMSNLMENLNLSVEVLGCSPIKSVSSRDKIGYGKRNLAEICDAGK